MRYILSLDQGTSSSRAILYDDAGQVVAQAQQTFDMRFPAESWVEQDPQDIWDSILTTARAALDDSGVDLSDIAGIGITNQRETTLVWDRQTGECIYPAIVWQDGRTAKFCAELADGQIGGVPAQQYVAEHTGLLLDPYFSGTKVHWILNNVEGARARAEAGELCFGTVDTYLMWKLTAGEVHRTDATNASRTLLFDIQRQCWDETMLEHLDIPASMLPEVCDSAGRFGETDSDIFGQPIPITGVAGDQQAALVGQSCFEVGQIKSTYGTGCFVMANTGSESITSNQKLLSTVAYRINGQATYALEGSIFVAGVAIKWLRDSLGLIDDAAETEAAFERTGGNSGGVYVVPAFTGLGAPYWQPDARGMITGLSLDSTRDHVVTATLQAIALQTNELLDAMAADGAKVAELRVDGGMVVNNAFCQFLANILDVPVARPADVETTALGAGMLAALGAGLYPDLASAGTAWQLDRRFEPDLSRDARDKLLAGYQAAIRQVRAPLQTPGSE